MKINTDQDIEKKVEEALRSLDNLQPAVPRPFFYTRLTARMGHTKSHLWQDFLAAPQYIRLAMASAVLLIIFNAYTALHFLGSSSGEWSDRGALLLSEYYDDAITPDNLESYINP